MKRAKEPTSEVLDARFTLRLPRAMLRTLKHAAVERDKSLQAFVLDALRQLAEKETER
jgi:uncharacterized protein (DUF1778 family)